MRKTSRFWIIATLSGSALWAQTEAPLSLTLEQATELALKNNVQIVLARERITEARGRQGTSLAALLPQLAASAQQSSVTTNLAAMGLSGSVFPGLDPFLGPFSVFDARIRATQSVFNLAAVRGYQAGREAALLAIDRQRFAEEQVTTATALAYLAVLEAEQSQVNAEANVQLARRLHTLALSQRAAGVATGVDVARAETRLANQQVQLAHASNALNNARLELLRVVGAPLSSTLKLAGPLRFNIQERPTNDAALRLALSERNELKMAERMCRISQLERKAAVAGWAPSVSVAGEYGSSGVRPNETNLPTRAIGIRADIPLFDGGRTRSQVRVAASLERQAAAQRDDLRLAIEKDVRRALDTLAAREVQVGAAQKALALATRELALSEDRFKNGVADNVEVLSAQTALENARMAMTASLAQFNIARLDLASATGRVNDFRL